MRATPAVETTGDTAAAPPPGRLAQDVLTRYLELCDVPPPPDATGRLVDLFTPDAVWEGVGPLYSARFGRTTGAEAIAEMVAAHLPPHPHFRANVHLLHPGTTWTDGHTGEVRGRWLMQQLSRYTSGAAEAVVARLDVTFRIEGNAARIAHFRTERLFDAELGPAPAAPPRETAR
ncbi:nuclear transport factor 2 family protein [Streptomyces sp. NPDC047117]|uniref:nuclear transport factor 2 family protein n=1 Tax=Streptomyces sp. NPDC047117 TaxID=3155379 RepID=UPI0033C98979